MVYNELHSNLAALNKSIPYHKSLIGAFDAFQDGLRGLPVEARQQDLPMTHLMRVLSKSDNAMGASQLKNTAWRFLEGSEAYDLLDYEIASALASVYQTQETGVQHTVMLIFEDVFWSKDLFRPEETLSVLGLSKLAFTELHGQEAFLSRQIEMGVQMLKDNYPIAKQSE